MFPIAPFLQAAQNPDGGWGYAVGQASTVEPTAAVILALSLPSAQNQAGDALLTRALDWLRKGQHADGSWGYTHADRDGTWLTGWALLAWARCNQDKIMMEAAVTWLLNEPVMTYADDELQVEFRRTSGIDISVQGWPWLPGEASWVEPTAMAMLALLELPVRPALTLRLKDGARCLQDRRCVGGGWNVGSPVMLGAALPARIVPTAWAILAYQKLSRRVNWLQQGVLEDDILVLRREMSADGSLPALAWGLLALKALEHTDPVSQTRLAASQDADGGWEANPYYTALAALALGEEQL